MSASRHDGTACYLADTALLLEIQVWRQWAALAWLRRLAARRAALRRRHTARGWTA